MRYAVLILALSVVAACSPRGRITVAPEAQNVGMMRSVFVSTTRAVDETGQFDGKRSETLAYGRYDISIPPDRKAGEITWPKRNRPIDPQTQFLTTNVVSYPKEAEFRKALSTALRPSGNEAVVFVHGFNNTFGEGLYRIAQLSNDLEMTGAVVHYSWPSAAEPLGYVYDRDSMLFARDGLEALIREIRLAGAQEITLVAHSMGSALLMEALRTLAVRGDQDTLNRIQGVILISPDIDVDVFRMQAKAIGRLPQPFLIFGSEKDRVLRLSGLLTGQNDRLGTLQDIREVADLDVTFVDVAAFAEGSGHFTLGNSETLLKIVGGISAVGDAYASDQSAQTGLLSGTVLTVQTATRVVLNPVVQIGNDLRQ